MRYRRLFCHGAALLSEAGNVQQQRAGGTCECGSGLAGVVRLLILGLAVSVLAGGGRAQQQVQSPRLVARLSYIAPTLVPSNVREYLMALGDRLQRAGKERLVLSGTYSDRSGAAGQAQLTWEAPGSLRLDRSGGQALVFDGVAGVVNPAGLTEPELGILESLVQDSPEGFLYGFPQGCAFRFLGARFRADDGKSRDYQGPWFDIYETVVLVRVLSGTPLRQKHFYFDTRTKLFVKAKYVVQRGGTKVLVFDRVQQLGNQGRRRHARSDRSERERRARLHV